MSAVAVAPTDTALSPEYLVAELWRRGVRIYPDLKNPEHLNLLNPYDADYSDLRPALVDLRAAVYWHLWDSFSPQSAGEYAAFLGFGVAKVASILRRGVIERRAASDRFDRSNYTPEIWNEQRILTFAEHCVSRADRYPEWLVSHGLGRWPHGPRFPLNEEVAYTLLEDGFSPADALAVLQRRNDVHQVGFTRDELVAHIAAAGALLTDGSNDYSGLLWHTLMRKG